MSRAQESRSVGGTDRMLWYRLERGHCLVRWCIPIPEPSVLEEMVAVQRVVRSYTGDLQEIRCLGVVYLLLLVHFPGIQWIGFSGTRLVPA